MTSAFSWQNSISLCPDSFRIPRSNLPMRESCSGDGKGSRAPGDAHQLCDLGELLLLCSVRFLICVLGLDQICLAFVHHWPFQLNLCPQSMSLLTSEWGRAVTWGGSALPWMWAPKGEQSPWGCRTIEWQPLCSVSTLWVQLAPLLPSA